MKKYFMIFLVFITALSLYAEETPKGRFSGLMFGDFFYNAAMDPNNTIAKPFANSALKGAKDLDGIQFRRIYFTYDYDISTDFTTRFRLEADQAALTSNGKIGVAVKDAWLKWKNIFSGSDLIIGIQPTPAFDISEGVWNNRFLEKTQMDLRGAVSSRDLAVSLRGKIDNNGMFKYWVMYGDGSQNTPETDKYKRYYANIQVTPIKNLTFTLYADYNARAQKLSPDTTVKPVPSIDNNQLTYAFFAGYSEKNNYMLGFELFNQTSQNGIISGLTAKDQSALGFSVFGSYNFTDQLALVARYDSYDPNTDSSVKGDSRGYFIGSLNYSPVPNVTISPNVLVETYETLPAAGTKAEVTYKSSVVPRITFFYSF